MGVSVVSGASRSFPAEGFQFFWWEGDIAAPDKMKTPSSLSLTKPVPFKAVFVTPSDKCHHVPPSGDNTDAGFFWKTAFATPEAALEPAPDDDQRILKDKPGIGCHKCFAAPVTILTPR